MIKKLIRKLLPACILAGGLLLGVMVMVARADSPIVDLFAGEEDLRVVGESALDWMGEMTTGDINADGIPDLIVGASGYDVPGYADAGAVYVIFGASDLSGTVDLNNSGENADIVIHGYRESGGAGHVVASGDLNGDDYADLIIGASTFSHDGRVGTGAVFVIYGPITEPVTAPIPLNDSEWVGLTIYGQLAGDRFGRAVAVGDVNDDGVDDLIGGAYLADRTVGANCGRVYVFYGGGDLTSTLDLNTTSADVMIVGAAGGNRLGRSIATGDVDGDGVADLIIGMYAGGPGEVVLIYGSDALLSTIDLRNRNIIAQGLGLRFQGVNYNDGVGFYVAAGNINGDRNPDNGAGYADILAGAYLEDFQEDGIGYMLYGGSEITAGVTITSDTWTVPISACADLTLYPAASQDRLGRSVASGDLNADGYDDWVIGASRADPDERTNAGETYVFYGSPHLSGTITVSPTDNTDLTVLGDRPDDEAGRSATVGDINGDDIPDLIIGAVMAVSQIGEAYVVWGPSATGISITASTDVITAGQPITFVVTASNRYSQTWDVTGYATTYTTALAAGGAWSQNHYTAEVAGAWVITAAHQGLIATTVITVTPDAATTLTLAPAAASIVAGEDVTYTVIATDAYGNGWDVTTEAGYVIAPDAGGSWAANAYSGAVAGTWTVTATYGLQIATASLTVSGGALAHLALTPATASLTAGDTQLYSVAAFDAYGNPLGDVTASAEYTITPTAGGSWAANAYSGAVAGTWTVTATYGLQIATARLTVSGGALDHIVLRPRAASIFAGQTQVYTVKAFDAYGNWLGDVTASAAYTITPAAGGSWAANVYTAEVAGTWTVTARVGGVETSTTLTVISGALDHIVLLPVAATIAAGQGQTYTVEAFDIHNNFLGDVTASAEYTITLAAGGSWDVNAYTSAISGTWMVTASYGTQTASATLTVTAPSPVTYTLHFNTGWNLIALPLNPLTPFSAQSLLNTINDHGGSCIEVNRWFNGGWDGHIGGAPFNDFDIEPGVGYFIRCSDASDWTMTGMALSEGVSVQLLPGWNLIGIPYPATGYVAESVLDDIVSQSGACSDINRWYNGGWDGHIYEAPFNNFGVVPDQGYFVRCSIASTFVPGE